MKVTLRQLRNVLREQLNHENHGGQKVSPVSVFRQLIEGLDTQEEIGDSLDAQVDRMFNGYEKSAKTAKVEGKDWRRTVRRLVSEAEDEETTDDSEESQKSDVTEEPPKLSLDDLDVEAFVNDVARLINNTENLLEVRSTLARRAENFLKRNYDEEVVDAAKSALREQHGIVVDMTDMERKSEDFVAPRAGEAGPGGGGV